MAASNYKWLTVAMLLICSLWMGMVVGDQNMPNTSPLPTTALNNNNKNMDDITYTEIVPIRFTWNKYTIIATATAAVVVVAGIVASASLLLPLITYKICYLFGACSYSLNSYADQFIAADEASPPGVGAETDNYPVYTGGNNRRQKRSLEYLGPIIQTLAAAYEKYGEPQGEMKKKFEPTVETHTFFTR